MVRGRPAFRAVGFSKPEAGGLKSFDGRRDARPTIKRTKVIFPKDIGMRHGDASE
jgi:hypothetical protein